MPATFAFFSDSGLTLPLSTLAQSFASDGSTGKVINSFWFGSPATGYKAQVSSAPGVDNLMLSIVDNDPSRGEPSAAVELSLNGSTWTAPGASLDLGTATLLSGAANALRIYCRLQDLTGSVGTYTDLWLRTQEIIEVEV